MKNFRKRLEGYTAAEVDEKFRHSVEVYRSFEEVEQVVFPKPISFSGDTINYEFVDLPSEFVPKIISGEVFDFYSIGRALATLHISTFEGEHIVHGDFVPHNLFVDSERIFIVDAHPPELIGYRRDLLCGSSERDVVAFIFTLFSDIGVKRSLLSYRLYIQNASDFLRGYLSFTKGRLNILGPLARYFFDVYSMRNKVGRNKIGSFFHCSICFFLSCVVGYLNRK